LAISRFQIQAMIFWSSPPLVWYLSIKKPTFKMLHWGRGNIYLSPIFIGHGSTNTDLPTLDINQNPSQSNIIHFVFSHYLFQMILRSGIDTCKQFTIVKLIFRLSAKSFILVCHFQSGGTVPNSREKLSSNISVCTLQGPTH